MTVLQQEIIQELGVSPHIDPEQEIVERSKWLAAQLAQTGLRGFVIGVSGGQDSLLAGMLAKRATELYPQASELHAMLLPYNQQHDRADALLARDIIQPTTTHDLNIQPAVDAFTTTYQTCERHVLRDFNKGNVKARVRMIAQYAIASEYQLLVLGTDHAAEAVTGFYTKFGDGAADILPLAGLTKRQGKMLLQILGAPAIFTDKAPTADLLDDHPMQTDEHELGIPYDAIDAYLEGEAIDEPTAARIEQRFLATKHKRALPRAFPRTAVGKDTLNK